MKKRKMLLVMIVSTLVVGISGITNGLSHRAVNSSSITLQHWVTGLVKKGNGSSLVAFDLINQNAKEVLPLPKVTPDNFGVVNSSNTYAAYTQWDNNQMVRYLTIQPLDKKRGASEDFFHEGKNSYEIKGLSWLPEGKKLLFIANDFSSFWNQEISILNVETKQVKTIVKGGVWNVIAPNAQRPPNDQTVYLTQSQLDDLVKKYGGKHVPIDQAGRVVFVKFSTPCLSPDKYHIAYSANLFRNSVTDPAKLWMGSAIWLTDIDGKSNKIIYASNDDSALGTLSWSLDGNKIAFARYLDMNGENGRIDLLDLKSNTVKIEVPTSEQHFTNLNPLFLPNGMISFSSVAHYKGPEQMKRYVVSPETGNINVQAIPMSGVTSFTDFTPVH